MDRNEFLEVTQPDYKPQKKYRNELYSFRSLCKKMFVLIDSLEEVFTEEEIEDFKKSLTKREKSLWNKLKIELEKAKLELLKEDLS